MKRCPKCGGSFASYCKPCDAKRCRDYYERNREKKIAAVQEWNAAHPQQRRDQWASLSAEKKWAKSMQRHGGPEVWAQMWSDQRGLCLFCNLLMDLAADIVHVDHDHSHVGCGRDASCRVCRRGLVHAQCNTIWGLAGESRERLLAIAEHAGRVTDETRARIAADNAQQLSLFA